MYSLSRVTKSFGSQIVLDIDQLDIKCGLIHALLGPNGAGKTTLLRILAFLDKPTTGEIKVQSQPVVFSDFQLLALRKRVVMVNQNPILFSTSVFGNVEFGLKIRKVPQAERERKVKQALALVNMEHKAQARAQTLSGGETQRVALARAFVLKPEVILCDEPTANVDQHNRTIVMDLLREFNKRNQITVIFTTHDRNLAASLAHRTISLDGGRLTSAFHDNLFRAIVCQRSGQPTLVIEDQLELPGIDLADFSTHRCVRIDPELVKITQNAKKTEGVALFGIVTQISYELGRVRLQLNAGIQLTLMLSLEEYQSINPQAGQRVPLFLPLSAIAFCD